MPMIEHAPTRTSRKAPALSGMDDNLEYGAWGEGRGPVGTPFGWTGRWGGYGDSHVTKVINWNRWYQPNAGSWDSRDLRGVETGPFPYSYAFNNPNVLIDIDGLAARGTFNGPSPYEDTSGRFKNNGTNVSTSWFGPWYGNWTGPGNRRNPKANVDRDPIDSLDAAAMIHDHCYGKANISFMNNTPLINKLDRFKMSEEQKCEKNQCDQDLCNAAKDFQPYDWKSRTAKYLVKKLFCK